MFSLHGGLEAVRHRVVQVGVPREAALQVAKIARQRSDARPRRRHGRRERFGCGAFVIDFLLRALDANRPKSWEGYATSRMYHRGVGFVTATLALHPPHFQKYQILGELRYVTLAMCWSCFIGMSVL